MPTETEHYTEDELLRDVERDIEAERTHEEIEDGEFEKAEDDFEFPKETEDPALQDVLEYKGGHPEDWELTHQSSGEYMFNGSEMINTNTGESLTKQIEGGFDEGYIAAHHQTLEQLKSGESMIRLPDFEEEKENGDVVLHITHLLRGADDSISYEIRSTVISQREEEEIFDVEEVAETAQEQNHVEFYEEAEVAPEERVETVAETFEHMHETTFDSAAPAETAFETPVTQEAVAPITMRVEERAETVLENPTNEIVSETKEEVKETSWLSRFLRSESPTFAPEENNSLESLPVFVENVDVVEVTEQITLEMPEFEINPAAEIEQIERVIEQPVEQAEQTVSPLESFVAPQIEHVPASAQQTVEIQREIFESTIEEKLVVKKIEPVVEIQPIALKIDREEPAAKIESIRPITVKTSEVNRPESVKMLKEIRAEIKPEKQVVEVVQSKPVRREVFNDAPTSFEKSKSERIALSGNEILLRSLGIPTAPRFANVREFMNPESLRASRYSPPQNDNAPVQTTTRRSLNGISMRRAA